MPCVFRKREIQQPIAPRKQLRLRLFADWIREPRDAGALGKILANVPRLTREKDRLFRFRSPFHATLPLFGIGTIATSLDLLTLIDPTQLSTSLPSARERGTRCDSL